MAFQKKSKKLDADGLWEYGLRLLGGRAMSTGEVREKMRLRAGNVADIDGVMTRLAEYHFLNDERFAGQYAAARLDNQGFGKMRVLQDLRKRRVSATLATEAVAKTFEGVDEEALVAQYLDRKLRGKNAPVFLSEAKNLASTYRRLRMAGFSSGASIKVLKRYSVAAEQLEDLPGGDA